ncbi:N-acetylmuramoyl-L-alanine amidase [Tumebacillus sp. BK434]|uniref:N-acetylmuramoyl-L-alanine amidase family protein n=1 Tax=Tumebacillus sp. BK434 TaxID=2512169 RepID=UPI001052976A|nr:N-acetylmuramoyl-L-alanine amidase [Tumebacillus sp. BK434]TCP55944.1 N-acetylmuramoyl-L-alanine amidase [Tumebacillus sp. BK434]
MKMAKTLVAALVCTTILSTPALAAKDNSQSAIAPEGLSTSEPAPANYNPSLKKANDASIGTEAIGIEANPIIVLDPGHGGSDPGAVGNGIEEADVVLDIATRSKNYIVANYPATVYMTRTADTTLTLGDRTTFANNKGANFFVSFHINSYTSSTANGLETYYYPGSTNGQNLATNLYNKLKAHYSTLRGVKSADFYVLHYTNMPASLGETGFISNATDATNLKSATFKQNLAVAYSQGMHVYWWGF